MRVAITGSSGFIGTAVRARLGDLGHDVLRLVRREPAAADEARWDPGGGVLEPSVLEGCHGVVNLAGAGLGGRWSEEYKRVLRRSRVPGTELMARTLAGMAEPPGVLVSGSAIGYYGADRDGEDLTEDSSPGEDFLARLVVDWEAATGAAAEAGIRVVLIRTGLVLGAGDGLLARMVPPARLGLGGRLGSGRQWMSWVSIDDEVSAIVAALTEDRWSGPVNVTAPDPVTNAAFTKELGRVLHRPTLLAVPTVVLRTLFGAEMADCTILASQRVRPAALAAGGFVHADPALGPTLERLLG